MSSFYSIMAISITNKTLPKDKQKSQIGYYALAVCNNRYHIK